MNAIVRNVLSALAGYAIFVATSIALFQLLDVNPHAPASAGLTVFVACYGLFFSSLGGWATKYLSNSNRLTANYILATIIAGFAAFSFFKASGEHWTQLLAIFLFAPASLVAALIGRVKK